MTLQSSGPISLEDIQAEFQSPATNISLQAHYRGGAFVPDIAANSGVPTSGPISVQDFYGATNFQIVAGFPTVIHDVFGGPTTVTATLEFRRDGTTLAVRLHSANTAGEWADPESPTIGDDWQVRYDVLSGNSLNIGGGDEGVWLTMSSTRQFGQTVTGSSGLRSSSVRIRIRDVATMTEELDETVSMLVEITGL